MNETSDKGSCENCHFEFNYSLIHNGFNESGYAYCNSCSNISVLSGWCEKIPEKSGFRTQGSISETVEPFLQSCKCGGKFMATAQPRCPNCKKILSAISATTWIEKNAPGTKKAGLGREIGLACTVS